MVCCFGAIGVVADLLGEDRGEAEGEEEYGQGRALRKHCVMKRIAEQEKLGRRSDTPGGRRGRSLLRSTQVMVEMHAET